MNEKLEIVKAVCVGAVCVSLVISYTVIMLKLK